MTGTLPQRMRYAAAILEQANARYELHADAPCSASWLRNEARHVEDEDKEEVEKQAMVEDLAAQLHAANSAEVNQRWDAAGSRDDHRVAIKRIARTLIESGWAKS